MTLLHSSTGTKIVKILSDTGYDAPIFRALYIQIYKGEQQVLDSKDYGTLKMAKKWAAKKLK